MDMLKSSALALEESLNFLIYSLNPKITPTKVDPQVKRIFMKDYSRCKRHLLLSRKKNSLQKRHYLTLKLSGPIFPVKLQGTAKN
jgi:hypothetical protein